MALLRGPHKSQLASEIDNTSSFDIDVPIELPSLNKLMSIHWRTANRIKKAQESAVHGALFANVYFPFVNQGMTNNVIRTLQITLTRVGKRKLDGDNLQGAFKKIRDVVSRALGVPDDDDSRLDWQYAQLLTRNDPYVTLSFMRLV